MQYKSVLKRQFAWIGDDLVRIVNKGVARDTPWFVANDSTTMFACRVRAVAVAVKAGCLYLVVHGILTLWGAAFSASSRNICPERILERFPRMHGGRCHAGM